MNAPKSYVSKPVGVLAIQWTGDNIRAIQDFVAPSSPYYQPARPATPGSASEILNEHRKALLSVMVPNPAANAQWPAIGPHYQMASVGPNGWLVKRDGQADIEVMTETTFREMFAPRPMVRVQTSDGSHMAPAPLEGLAQPPAPFQPGEPLLATHPRAATTSDVRVAPPPPRIVNREPDAADDGSTIDIEAPDAGDGSIVYRPEEDTKP